MKKTLSAFVLAAVLAFTLSFSAIAASSNGINISETQLRPGDEFTVTIIVPASENADTLSIKAEYDGTVFDTVSWEPEIPGGIVNSGTGFFVVASANASRAIDLSRGLVLSADLKVKDTAGSGDYTFRLTQHSISYINDNGIDYTELWKPEALNVTAHVEGKTAPAEAAAGTTEQEEEVLIEPAETTAVTAAPVTQMTAPSAEGKRLNPKTGITAAIVIPAAVTACVILARNTTKHRKRPKHKNDL